LVENLTLVKTAKKQVFLIYNARNAAGIHGDKIRTSSKWHLHVGVWLIRILAWSGLVPENATNDCLQPWAKVTFSATKLALFVLHQQWSVNHKNSTIVISIED